MATVQTAGAYAGTSRKLRHPKHTFNLKVKPWAIQPFMIAPVLPGETMKNLLMQSRVISDPLKSPIVGWWLDYAFFYVKHRDLDTRDFWTDMMLTPGWTPDPSVVTTAAAQEWYTFDGAIDWVKLCLEKVTDDWFRNEGEAWDAFKLASGTPLAGINQESWLNSMMMGALADSADVDLVVGVDDKVTAEEIDATMRQWQLLKMHNLTEMSYEDYLRQFGVRVAQTEIHKTEMIRLIREWSYPTNNVNPADGKPTTAVAYSIAERADKDRYFKEPGFIFGVTVARPKIYLDNLKGAAVGLMGGVLPWLPATFQDDAWSSLMTVLEGEGPAPSLAGTGTDYQVDIRDLFIYGDQFVNHTDDAFASAVALPTAGGQWRYATEAMADALFVNAGGTGALHVKHDGIVSLSIAGRQVDNTPGTPVKA